ncbi:MAG TPA: hypothetical protein VJK51_05135 [Candidatus Nanoarchaeia archaeon]|nr:hypothetical protein [Candidatus Nanoarchaeia archaeon]
MMRKGQSAIEFVLIVVGVLFFFVAFLYGVQSSIGDKTRELLRKEVQAIAFSVQEEIRIAAGASDGYSRTFVLPPTALQYTYTVGIVDGVVQVATVDGKEALTLPVGNVTGDVVIGENLIRKEQGRVWLN